MSLPEDISAAERDFVELATRPLAEQPELREAAQIELLGKMVHTDPAKRGSLAAEAAARLAKAKPPDPERGIMGRIAAAWLLLAAIAALQAFALSQEDRPRELAPRKYPVPTTEQYEFSDPAELEDYLVRQGKMPPDFHEIWTSIDPDNGAWPWFEALSLAGEAYEKNSSRSPSSTTWPRVEFSRIWQLVEQAVNAPRFEWYSPERRAARQAAAGAGQTVLSIASQTYQNPQGGTESRAWSSIAEKLFKEQATRLVITGDVQGLKRSLRIRDALILRIGQEVATLEEVSSLESLSWSDALIGAAHELLPSAEATRLVEASNPIWAATRAPSFRDDFSCGDALPRESFWSWKYFMEKPDPKLPEQERGYMARALFLSHKSPAEYEPGRLAEYTLTERLLALAAAVFLLVAMIPAWLKGIWHGRRIHGLAEGLAPLLDKRDWLWLLGLGIVAPLAWYWSITRLTPFGGRATGGSGLIICLQASLVVLLALVMIGNAVNWRIRQRMAVVGRSSRRLWPGWCVAILLAAAVPLASFYDKLPQAGSGIPGLTGVAAILLALLGMTLAVMLASGRAVIFGVMICRTALPVMAAAVAVLLGTHAALLAKEKALLARDPLTGWDSARGTIRCMGSTAELVNARCRALWDERKSNLLAE